MKKTLPLLLAAGGLLAPSAGCGRGERAAEAPLPPAPATSSPAPPVPASPAGAQGAFDRRLRELARTYRSFGTVDDVLRASAPCAPLFPLPSTADSGPYRFSANKDEYTHGKKLYLLYASEAEGGTYVRPTGTRPPGFAVVKEAWVPEEAEQSAEYKALLEQLDDTRPGAERGLVLDRLMRGVVHRGKTYYPGRVFGLFVMYKAEPGTPDTDDGWVYGTVTPDGKEVTSAGRVETCMGCHRRAPHDRLFGPPQ